MNIPPEPIGIMKFALSHLNDCQFIATLVSIAYQRTGCKFSIEFSGSKGYMSHIEFKAEGPQTLDTNRIYAEDLFTKKGRFRKKTIALSYCPKNGVFTELS